MEYDFLTKHPLDRENKVGVWVLILYFCIHMRKPLVFFLVSLLFATVFSIAQTMAKTATHKTATHKTATKKATKHKAANLVPVRVAEDTNGTVFLSFSGFVWQYTKSQYISNTRITYNHTVSRINKSTILVFICANTKIPVCVKYVLFTLPKTVAYRTQLANYLNKRYLQSDGACAFTDVDSGVRLLCPSQTDFINSQKPAFAGSVFGTYGVNYVVSNGSTLFAGEVPDVSSPFLPVVRFGTY